MKGLSSPFGGKVNVPALAGLAVFLVATAIPAKANPDPNLVKNGSFAITGGSSSFQFGTGYTSSESVANWATSGYNFVYVPNTADSTGATGSAGVVKLWGPNDGSANGLPTSSPTGGNYVAADGAYKVAAITQTITGLNIGAKVYVSFAWAGAQQSGFTGPTTDNWTVDLGTSASQVTKTVSLVSEGFSGWTNETFAFIATSASETLSFLATGTPSGQPPFALLADVVVTAPEPAGVALMMSGIAAMVVIGRRRGTPTARLNATV